ncbi:class II aldolase/adducin family protein [Rhodovibrionaceae bacterium A322]
MSVVTIAPTRNNPLGVSDAEWQQRVDLAAAHRLLAAFDLAPLGDGLLALRNQDTASEVILAPDGHFHEEIRASDLLRLSAEGEVLSDSDHGADEDKSAFARAVLAARPDCGAVVVLPSDAALTLALMGQRLAAQARNAAGVPFEVYYSHLPLMSDGQATVKLLEDLDEAPALLVRDQGLLLLADSAPEAFLMIQRLDRACKLQLAAQQVGLPIAQPTLAGDILAPTAKPLKAADNWPALRRLLDRKSTGYQD